ncbi:2-phospho-L-lactate transferase [uncultured Amnibacterium sp.]|uniref:2-phospho-L-lactate transferase n=1 Tax=uncultured Amnibacterium sp. TaxID=1631851 RepID=UPI0035CC3DC9
MEPLRVVVLAGGVGGARFVRGLRAHLRSLDGPSADVTVVANTGDDVWLAGLRVTPDLDSLLYTLAGVNDETRGWGRAEETERVAGELAAFGVGWPWFTLGDLDLGTCVARTSMLRDGLPLSAAVQRLAARWPIGVRLLPATDDEVETHVLTDEGELHFEEWWVRTRAALPARAFVQPGVEAARPAPGVVEAIRDADVVLLAPSNPVVSIGTILTIPGIREALAATPAPVVGLSPVIGGSVVRGMADACLTAIGVATDAGAIAQHYGPRSAGGVLDGWLVDEVDAAALPALAAAGIRAGAVPLWMTDDMATAAMAAAALRLAREPR